MNRALCPSFPVRLLPLLAVAALVAVAAGGTVHAQTPSHIWSTSLAGVSDDRSQAVAVDASGNVFITGSYAGSIPSIGPANGGTDIFLAKYDANGVLQWGQRYGGFSSESALGIAVDAGGNVIITGEFVDLISFGGSLLFPAGSSDVFVAKFTTNGAPLWSTSFGGVGSERGLSVAVDGSSGVLVTGEFLGTMTISGNNLVSAGGFDAFLVKYNSSGTYQWSKQLGGTGTDSGRSVAADVAGNVYATGYFSNTVNLGGGNLVSAGASDVYVAKYNAAGTHQWSIRHGGASTDTGNGIAVDGSGNVLLAGQFLGTTHLGGANLVSAGDWDGFFAKYNSAGAHQWSRRFGGTSGDYATSIVADATGNALVSGYFMSASVNLGGGTLVNTQNLFFDVFVAKYGADGTHKWSDSHGGTNDDIAWDVAADASGNAVLTGVYTGAVSFGGAILPGVGMLDIFVARYTTDALQPAITSITDVPNDQGREVVIGFDRAGNDKSGGNPAILQYEVYRRNDPTPSLAGANTAALASERELMAAGWQFVSSVPAHGEASYLAGAPTRGDSTIVLGQYYSVFFVRASTSNPLVFYDSPIDSGWSVDNLAPAAPMNFAYNAGTLSWLESTAADFDYFSVYGSASPVFDGSATLIDHTTALNLNVVATPHVFYYVTATDFSGNEGKPARVNTLSGVGGPPAPATLSLNAYPNPFNPRTTIRYEVPSAGRVSVVVYDASGARVATLVNGTVGAGARVVDWDGRNDRGETVSSGVYLVEVRAGNEIKTRKVALVK